MMQAIKSSGLPRVQYGWRAIDPYCVQEDYWQLFARTTSNYSQWCFDRFRLFTADNNTEVEVRYKNGGVIDRQKFHSAGGWTNDSFEHTFTFDLSGNTNNEELEIFIKGVPSGAKFQQLYAYQTGYGATRYRNLAINNARLTYWDLNVIDFDEDSLDGNNIFWIQNNGLSNINGLGKIQAGRVYAQNNNLSSLEVDDLIRGCDANGKTNSCVLNISGNSPRTSASQNSWNNLAAKGWTLTE